jgi:hypothetical protein
MPSLFSHFCFQLKFCLAESLMFFLQSISMLSCVCILRFWWKLTSKKKFGCILLPFMEKFTCISINLCHALPAMSFTRRYSCNPIHSTLRISYLLHSGSKLWKSLCYERSRRSGLVQTNIARGITFLRTPPVCWEIKLALKGSNFMIQDRKRLSLS